MNADDRIFVLVAVASGLAVALPAWLLSRALSDVPAENRQYKDPPPAGFRVVWWPIQWISFYLQHWLPARTDAALAARLRKAGLDYALKPVQFVAARVVGSVLMLLAVQIGLDLLLRPQAGGQTLDWAVHGQLLLFGALFGWTYPALWLRDRIQARRRALLKALPFYLDIITLCVEAGLNLQGALHQAVLKGPKGIVREEFQRVLRDIRAGKPRAEALRSMATRLGEAPVTNFVSSVIQAERLGMNLGPVLRAQADQQRTDRFLRAEKLAMEAPVKLLFPLIAFIFPCTFIVLFFPIAIKFLEAGI